MKKLFTTGLLLFTSLLTQAQYTLTISDVVFEEGVIKEYLNTTEKDIIIPDHFNGQEVVSIGDEAFSSNDLTDVEIPNTVTSIGERAFSHNNLTSVGLPDSVTLIDAYAFNWNSLTAIVIPNSMTTIDGSSFWYNDFMEFQLPEHYQGYSYIWQDRHSEQEYKSGDTVYTEYYFTMGEKIQAIDFTITYHNIVDESTNPDTYTVEDADISLAPATKDGYTFEGWYDNAEFNGSPVTEITTGTTGNIELYAKFTQDTITSIASSSQDQISFYPNPCYNFINLQATNNEEVSIFSLDGTLKLTSKKSKVDVSALQNGTYIIKQGEFTSKLIKK